MTALLNFSKAVETVSHLSTVVLVEYVLSQKGVAKLLTTSLPEQDDSNLPRCHLIATFCTQVEINSLF